MRARYIEIEVERKREPEPRDGQTEKLQPHAAFRKRHILLCFIVIVKLSGRFCVKPIYAHVSRFTRDPAVVLYTYLPTHVMLPCIIPRNFLWPHARRNAKKETANNGARHCETICVGAKCFVCTDILHAGLQIFAFIISLNLINEE